MVKLVGRNNAFVVCFELINEMPVKLPQTAFETAFFSKEFNLLTEVDLLVQVALLENVSSYLTLVQC